MPGTSVLILFACSLLAWIGCWWKQGIVFRWIFAASDRNFVRSPNLDVGLVFLFGFANIAVMCLLVTQALLGTTKQAVPNEPTVSSQVESANIDTEQETVNEKVGSFPPAAAAKDPQSVDQDRPLVDQTSISVRLMQSSILVLIMISMILASRGAFGTRIWQWGWGPIAELRFWSTLRLSMLVFLLLVPPVLLLHGLLTIYVDYQHATLDVFRQMKEGGDWQSIVLVFANTAILVPLLEEFVFRGVIQGFAEQFTCYRPHWMRWILGPLNATAASWLGLTAAAREANLAEAEVKLKGSRGGFWGPIVFSSLLFSLAHSGQGPAPISLYFLAMGLGWIYKKTGNLSVCVFVHVMLNSWTLVIALLS